MKLAIGLVGLSAAVMVVMIFQAVSQELHLRSIRTRMSENAAEVKRKEESIIEMKTKIKEMKTTLTSFNTKIDELKKKKTEGDASLKESNDNLDTCTKDRAEDEKKKSEMGNTIVKLKADHGVAKQQAEESIRSLKQQILDRDRSLCAFADTTKEEARKLCGIFETPK